MKKYILLIVFVGCSFCAVAQQESAADATLPSSGRNLGLDYGAGFSMRSNPLAASFTAEAGYNQLLWGNWQNKEDVMYGYIRPSVKLASIFIINAAEAKLTFKPVSFVGLHAGKMISSRKRDNSPGANCDIHECSGVLASEFLMADIALAVGLAFYTGSGERKKVKSQRNELDFYDDLPAVIGQKGEDNIITMNHTLGYKFAKDDPDERLIALNFRRSEAEGTRSYSERVGIAYGHKYQDFRVLYLAGSYISDLQKRGATIAIQVEWLGGLKGLAL